MADYIGDAIYLLDLLVRMHEGYLDQGIMVKDAAMLRKNYRQGGRLKLDIISVLPTDFAYFFFDGKCSEQVPYRCRRRRLNITNVNAVSRFPARSSSV